MSICQLGCLFVPPCHSETVLNEDFWSKSIFLKMQYLKKLSLFLEGGAILWILNMFWVFGFSWIFTVFMIFHAIHGGSSGLMIMMLLLLQNKDIYCYFWCLLGGLMLLYIHVGRFSSLPNAGLFSELFGLSLHVLKCRHNLCILT